MRGKLYTMRFIKPSAWGRPAASTALALLLASPSQATPFSATFPTPAGSPVIYAQAQNSDTEAGAEALRKKLREQKQEEHGKSGGKAEGANETPAPATETQPAQAEQAPQPAEQPEAQPKQQASPAPPKAEEPVPAPEPKAEAAPQPQNAAPEPPARKKQAREKQSEQQNAAQGSGRKQREMQQGQGETSAPEPKRVTAPEPETTTPAAQQTESAPQIEQQTVAPAQGKSQKPERIKRQDQQKAAQPEMPAPKTVTAPKKQETAPAAESGAATPPQTAEPQQQGQSAEEKLRRDLREKLRRQTQQQAQQPAAQTPPQGELAPLTDSAKEATGTEPAAPQKPRRQKPGTAETQQTQTTPEQVITPQTMPKTDAAAQEPAIANQQIQSIQAESGTAVRSDTRPRRQFDDQNVVGRFGNRIVIRLDNGRLSIYSGDDHDRRLRRNADNTQVEQLRGGRLRETIYLRDGSRIVTIYNRDGDVLRRSRFLPDGREIVLVYVPRDRWDDLRDPYYDPGRYLPPLVLTIPRSDYIFERERASADDYYRFLRQPPVEPVPRLYSIDEVTRSARIRDMARRVDLVSVHFEFGSADISESEVDELQTLAEAMNRLLDDNPGEMFLIEGHTDAVGSEEANLVLSDKRAESVAEVLTDYFGIPPENMVTHGYGERYLKINTQAPERENRRVAIRRITPLVAPVNEQVLK